MADDPRTRRAPRARPLAELTDLAGDSEPRRGDELAKRWAIALILARPLEAIGEVPLEELAREAPELCLQMLRAVGSDVELARLSTSGDRSAGESSSAARRIAALAGAREASEAVDAVEALRGVLWEALLDGVDRPGAGLPSSRLLGDACDRLAHVCSTALGTALDAGFAPAPRRSLGNGERAPLAEPAARALVAASAAPGRRAVIIDEGSGVPVAGREPLAAHGAPQDSPAPEIAIRDERGEEGPAAWIGSIGARLDGFAADGRPFAVLLVELAELERLRREESAVELSRLAGRVEAALVAALGGWSGTLTRERPGRCWLLAPETDIAGARQLAERLELAVASGVSHRGAPLEVAIGTAVCPDEGRQPAALAAHADVGLYAARRALHARR